MATLPVATLLTLGLWWWPQGSYSLDYGVSLLLTALTAYLIIETNNSNLIIRTLSRMPSSVWLLGMGCIGLYHPFHPAVFVAFCLSVSYYLLFRTYQQTEPVMDAFHAFLMLGAASMVYPPMAYFYPFFLWYILVFMRALTLRVFFSALVGFLAPYWLWGGVLFWQMDAAPLFQWAEGLTSHFCSPKVIVTDLCAEGLSSECIVFALLSLLALWTGISYLTHSYDDKIRTRMILYIYAFQTALIVVYALCSAEWVMSIPLLMLSATPLIAHYFTLIQTWTSLFIFVVALLLFALFGVLTLSPYGQDVINFVNPALHIG